MALQRNMLRLVETQPFHEELPVESRPGELHSLHSLVEGWDDWDPFVVRELVLRYSSRGDKVLVESCGYGAASLETALLGRPVIATDTRPLAVTFARARLEPADIAEVALFLQMMNLKRPVDLRQYNQDFSLFFDVDTFCELWNLKAALVSTSDRVARFVQVLVGSILHGHTASHLSVYTSPRDGLTPEAQARLNRKRKQIPGYRAIAPRVLKKSAFVTRDGISSELYNVAKESSFSVSDPRDLANIKSGSIDLVLTKGAAAPLDQGSWLRRWFFSAPTRSQSLENYSSTDPESVYDFSNASLLEAARVTRSGGRAVVHVPVPTTDPRLLDRMVRQYETMVSLELSRYWRYEGLLELEPKAPNCLKPQVMSSDLIRKGAIVLRRK